METHTSKNSDSMTSKKQNLIKESEYTKYFLSKEHEFAFYFKVNNPIFDEYLGIKKIHTIDMGKAKELKNSYLRMFHPDRHEQSNVDLNYNEICVDISTTFFRVSGGRL